MSLKRHASVLTATLVLMAGAAGIRSFSPASLALDFSPLHREAQPTFQADTYSPAAPPQFQTNNAARKTIDRHARHRTL